MLGREELVDSINTNIQIITECFEIIENHQIEKIFKKLEDIFFFYGFEKEEIMQILKKGAINYSDKYKLAELYGVTNALLFQLRYKTKLNIEDPKLNKDIN